MASLPETTLAALQRFVERRMGLYFAERRQKDLLRGVLAAAKAFGVEPLEEFVAWLIRGEASAADLEKLASHLTIGETYFFRDKRAFAALEKIILPELIKKRRHVKRLRIWCAGCSSGEEPYSIAILLRRLIPDIREWSIDLSGTDINLVSLRRATVGEYSKWSFRDCNVEALRPHVVASGRARYRVSDTLRRSVRFSYLNLVEDAFPSVSNNTAGEDLVICRNVLMYFRPERAEEVAHRLFQCVVDDGYMLLGPAELHMLRAPAIESLSLEGSTCFRHRPTTVPASSPREFGWQPTVVTRPRIDDVTPAIRARIQPLVPRPRPPRPTAAGRGARYKRSMPVYLQAEKPVESPTAKTEEPRALANSGQLDRALHQCNDALAADNTQPQLHYLKATICFELGHSDEASKSLRKALYLSPDYIAAHFTAGMVARAVGRVKEANRHFRAARGLLADKAPDWEVPDSDGMAAGRMAETVNQLLELGGEQ